jgi:putative MFS transporter
MRGNPSSGTAIGSRLDRLPMTWPVWRLVVLLSAGAFFEIYDLFLTADLSPGLVRAGIFRPEGSVLWGLSSQATFAAATFAGLFVGTIAFSGVADRFGRRPIFTFSLLWYSLATVAMALQSTAMGIYCWRFVAGVGLGVELVTIDAYLSEFVPKRSRTRAFACNAAIQFLGVPVAAFLAWILVPRSPAGIDGWRWVALISAAGALVVWVIRSRVPESPRWLAEHGRGEEAERIVAELEEAAGAKTDPIKATPEFRREEKAPRGLGRLIGMLIVFQFFQTIGFYGFGNWLPTLLAAGGASVIHSLQYSFAIALAYPLGPILCFWFADRFEPKWQIVASALAVAGFGLVFAGQNGAPGIILFGILVTFANCAMSYAYHAYQSELFPTRIRARAIGFCYSWSRLSTVFSSFMIAFFLARFGRTGVFVFIAASMGVVALVIGGLGPRTRGRSLEQIAAES